ncbi:MAG: HicB family protein [Candidatus Nealsonbacteria bacterium CG_4_10_14_0_2_um_filter_37_10]|uniref:HicB family protein n=3 Tax=Candidatus Nealsoniibacteriota TaxID=1817911 RepID=A0A2H0TJS9_9BACT|nr:MAG: HicB family protein [Candidatus Nealsonbacteria bacterium CG10_big_fil_rev_8_21_14_0_10_37_25]PIZ89492.1 MAG: HicB family protein [Candidatus Nealsonbacteria bacterium CG_4_10_14_0_2_um_filter_37_10]PJA84973.1 MAG: HicB family protein [Candidatus Nealsonbacteria bacterium CG_4_9_14_3_um_filter_37_13]
MLSEYIEKKLKTAKYKLLKDGSYFGEIPGLKGVWANARNLEDCRKELQEVLEDWLLLKVRLGERISGFEIRFDRRQLVKHA